MAGPAVVVVAGIFTAWLAVRSDDGLVAEDYYRRGLSINRDIAKVEAGVQAGVTAAVTIRDGVATVRLATRDAEPQSLRLSLRHPTRAGLDNSADLLRIGPGTYRAAFPPTAEGNWRIVVETPQWKIAADATIRNGVEVALKP